MPPVTLGWARTGPDRSFHVCERHAPRIAVCRRCGAPMAAVPLDTFRALPDQRHDLASYHTDCRRPASTTWHASDTRRLAAGQGAPSGPARHGWLVLGRPQRLMLRKANGTRPDGVTRSAYPLHRMLAPSMQGNRAGGRSEISRFFRSVTGNPSASRNGLPYLPTGE